MYVHALHTVHALPDLRVAAERLRDGVCFLVEMGPRIPDCDRLGEGQQDF